MPFSPDDRSEPSHHLAVIVLPESCPRDAFRAALKERGIQTSVHYPPIHRFSHYRSPAVVLPNAEAIADHVLTLPLHPRLSEADVDEVCSVLLEP